MKELLPYMALAISAIACATSIWTAVRSASWRNSEAHAALVRKVGEIDREQGLLKQRLLRIEQEIDDLPTREDIARVEGKIDGNSNITLRVEQAVIRLQDAWINANPAKK